MYDLEGDVTDFGRLSDFFMRATLPWLFGVLFKVPYLKMCERTEYLEGICDPFSIPHAFQQHVNQQCSKRHY